MTRDNLREFVLYGAASAGALALDVGILALLTRIVGVHYLIAASLAFVGGTLFVYAVCVRMVFRSRRVHSAAPEFIGFVAIGVIGLAVNAAVIFGGVEWLGINLFVTKGCAAVLTFCINFFLRKLLLFTPAKRLAAFGDLA